MTRASRIFPLALLLFGCHHHHDGPSDLGGSDAAMSDAAMTSTPDAGPGPTWAAARIASPIPYTAPEAWDYTAPQVLAGGKVLYHSTFGDGSWHLVLQNEDGTGATSLLESTSVPGYTLGGALAVPESNAVVVLLSSQSGFLPGVLEAVSLSGGAPVVIEANALSAVVTADGTRVVYLASGATSSDPPVVRISSMNSPSPQTLGMLDAGATFDAAPSLTRSSSAASNTPFFYLNTGVVQAGMCTVRAFGTVPKNAPATIQFAADACAAGGDLDGSANGRFVKFDRVEEMSSLVDTQTGTVSTPAQNMLSPDRTRWYVTSASGVTIYAQDGTSVSATIVDSFTAKWSADSTQLFTASTSEGQYSIVNAATGAITTSGTSACGITSLLADKLHAISTPGYGALFLVDVSDGTCQQLTTATTYGITVADTGTGVVFPDGWGVYYVKYDGTGRVRLDTPRTGEVTLGTGTTIADTIVGASGWLWWDAATQTVLLTPITSADEALSAPAGTHVIATTKLAAPATVQLTTGMKLTGQIAGFEQNFALFPSAGKVLFESVDGSRGAGGIPSIVSVGSLSGGTATQLGSFPTSGVYGWGEYSGVGVLGGPATMPTGALYDSYDLVTGFSLEVQPLDGSTPTTFTGYRLRFVSPDGTLAFVTDHDSAGYVVSTSPTSTAMPKLVSGTVAITNPSACSGCNGDDSYVYTDGAGFFTADNKLLLNGTAQGASAASTFYVDPSVSSPTPTDLAITNLFLLPDGLTLAGTVVADRSIVVFAASTPAQRTTLAKGYVIGASADGTRLVFEDDLASAQVLSSVLVAGGQVTSLMPSSPMQGGTVSSVSVSADGTRVFGEYTVGLSTPGACGSNGVYGFASNLDGTSAVLAAHPCDVQRMYPTGDYSALVYFENDTLYAVQGTSPLALTEPTERTKDVWYVPGSNQLVVRTIDAQNVWHLIAIHADGTKRAEIGDALPVQKQVIDVQFDPGHVVIDTDALTDGTLELFRFSLPD